MLVKKYSADGPLSSNQGKAAQPAQFGSFSRLALVGPQRSLAKTFKFLPFLNP